MGPPGARVGPADCLEARVGLEYPVVQRKGGALLFSGRGATDGGRGYRVAPRGFESNTFVA